jgi:hypothetical protein
MCGLLGAIFKVWKQIYTIPKQVNRPATCNFYTCPALFDLSRRVSFIFAKNVEISPSIGLSFGISII